MGERLLRFHGDVVLSGIPLGRAGEPAEIGRAAVFLASADAAWITGKILRVDGGAWM
jgi:NAD(P)-dependent dehydrogenase (short-subunit alcohol dehydrogenase family)